MVDKLNNKDKYFAIIYYPKESKNKKDSELLDYFATIEEAEQEVKRQKDIDKRSGTEYKYDILEKTAKQIRELW